MTADKLIQLLRENASELSKHVRRLKIGDTEIEFIAPESVLPVAVADVDLPPAEDAWTYGDDRGVPSFGRRDDG